jgi:hypothetical protein
MLERTTELPFRHTLRLPEDAPYSLPTEETSVFMRDDGELMRIAAMACDYIDPYTNSKTRDHLRRQLKSELPKTGRGVRYIASLRKSTTDPIRRARYEALVDAPLNTIREEPISPEKRLPLDMRVLITKPSYLLHIARHGFALSEYCKLTNTRYDSPEQITGEQLYQMSKSVFEALGKEQYLRKQQELVEQLFAEYESFLRGIAEVAPPNQVCGVGSMSDTGVLLTKHERKIDHAYPAFLGNPNAFRMVGSSENHPRDMFTHIGGLTFIDPMKIPLPQTDTVIHSFFLSDGGCTFNTERKIITTELYTIDPQKADNLTILRDHSLSLGLVPPVDPKKQPYPFVENHLDGHVNLITGADGKTYLLVVESYARQDTRTLSAIQDAARTISAQVKVIPDTDLDPLPLNFIQFPSGHIAYSTSTSDTSQSRLSSLDVTLTELVGESHLIPVPSMATIIGHTKGGLRCMTNIVLQGVIDIFNKQIQR